LIGDIAAYADSLYSGQPPEPMAGTQDALADIDAALAKLDASNQYWSTFKALRYDIRETLRIERLRKFHLGESGHTRTATWSSGNSLTTECDDLADPRRCTIGRPCFHQLAPLVE